MISSIVRLLARIPSAKKISNSILEKKWPRSNSNVKDDPYEALVLAYSREMDQLVEANTISNEVEEEDFVVCPNGEMTKLNDKKESTVPNTPCPEDAMSNEEEESMELTIPRTKTCSNDVSNIPKKIGYV
jgi:hypothetical protein